MATKPAATQPQPRVGRVARTKGVSLLPAEYDDAVAVEEMTGVGFSEIYRRCFAPQLAAAAALLREARDAGVELDRAALRDTWDIRMTPAELASLYSADSELVLGD